MNTPKKINFDYDEKMTLWEKFWDFVLYDMKLYSLRRFLYGTRNRFIKKYYLIDTGLKKAEWWDTDSKILHGVMCLLVDYVDKERCFEKIDWDSDVESKFVKKEIIEIYDWWKDYNNREKEIDEKLHEWHSETFGNDDEDPINDLMKLNDPASEKSKVLFKELNDLEKKLNDEETDMLIRIIKIRKYLWT